LRSSSKKRQELNPVESKESAQAPRPGRRVKRGCSGQGESKKEKQGDKVRLRKGGNSNRQGARHYPDGKGKKFFPLLTLAAQKKEAVNEWYIEKKKRKPGFLNKERGTMGTCFVGAPHPAARGQSANHKEKKKA